MGRLITTFTYPSIHIVEVIKDEKGLKFKFYKNRLIKGEPVKELVDEFYLPERWLEPT